MAKTTTMDPKKPQASGSAPGPGGHVPTPKINRGFKQYWIDVSRELKKVNWPSRRETTRLTGVVLTVCVLVAAILYAMSYIAGYLLQLLQQGF